MDSNSYNDKYQIIGVNSESHNLELYEDKFNQLVSKTTNKLFVLGAVGKMRVGKSSALNNFLTVLTGKDTRPFSELACVETNTRGIHIVHIKFEDLIEPMKKHFLETFKEQIDVILLDCEGTESSDNIGTSKLYLINMLINSVIHIHVSKSIDQNFANKLSQALISSQKVIDSLGADIREILPGLYILIKDTTEKAWENAKRSDPKLVKYEDLLKKYDNLFEYYKQFPSNSTTIVPPPLLIETENTSSTTSLVSIG